MTTIGRIVDVSSNQHPDGKPIQWEQVARAGVTAAIIKATEGTSYVNPFYLADAWEATEAGLHILAYHYAGFGNPLAEAHAFMAHAGPKARVLDIETSRNAGWARAFLGQLGVNAAETVTYGSASNMGDIRGQLPSLTWVAAYGQLYPGYGVMWQFTNTSEIPGIPARCDESSWHGSVIQYETLFGLTSNPT